MSLKRLKPRTFSAEQDAALQSGASKQEAVRGVPKSADPINYPVWNIPVNKKVLIYVPNHVVQDSDGVAKLRMDTPLIHSLIDGSRFVNVRCISGLPEGTGYSGNCPLCDGAAGDPWELAKHQIANKCRAMGLDPEDTEAEQVKQVRREYFGNRVIKESRRFYTFPIVVFDTENDDGKTFVYDEKGLAKYKVYWYHISEDMYDEKWGKVLENMEDEPTHPGGKWFVLNYMYTPKRGEPNVRDAARNLVVGHRNVKGVEEVEKQLDKQTEGWTPKKAQEMVISNQFYEEEDLQEMADDVLAETRRLLALCTAPDASGDDSDGFKLTKVEAEPDSGTVGIESDLDME